MNYLKDYFNNDISLTEWKKLTDTYSDYLLKHKEVFDEETLNILISGELHDAKIKQVMIDGYDTTNESDDVFVNLTLLIDIDDDLYKINYRRIKNFSLNSIIQSGYGFEDILVDECLITDNGMVHELVFVGEQTWSINCHNFFIYKSTN